MPKESENIYMSFSKKRLQREENVIFFNIYRGPIGYLRIPALLEADCGR